MTKFLDQNYSFLFDNVSVLNNLFQVFFCGTNGHKTIIFDGVVVPKGDNLGTLNEWIIGIIGNVQGVHTQTHRFWYGEAKKNTLHRGEKQQFNNKTRTND